MEEPGPAALLEQGSDHVGSELSIPAGTAMQSSSDIMGVKYTDSMDPSDQRGDEGSSHEATQEPTSSRLCLMGLPAETRNEIYRLAATELHSILVKIAYLPEHQRHWTVNQIEPPLALSSKTLRAEVLPVFYASNVFDIDIGNAGPPMAAKIQKWLHFLGKYAKYLTHLHMWFHMWTRAAVFTSKGQLSLEVHEVTFGDAPVQGSLGCRNLSAEEIGANGWMPLGHYQRLATETEDGAGYCCCTVRDREPAQRSGAKNGRLLVEAAIQACSFPVLLDGLELRSCKGCRYQEVKMTKADYWG